MVSTDLTFDILARDRASKTFDAIDKSASRTSKTLGALGRGVATTAKAVGAIGVAAGAGIVIFAKGAVAEAREAQKVGATTAQIIKATGGAAKVTAGQVGDLAERLSVKAGVDDEVIQTGANLLLTFKNVRNEAGKGAKIFDRATAAAVDLSSAGFGSVDSSAKMLGKALNDPVKGITALSRAGVTFTEGQKKQIEAMVEAGDILGAQKIILKEVESQVGGVAAASATAGEKAAVAWGNFQEEIGTRLLPVIDMAADAFVAFLPQVLKFADTVTKRIGPAFKTAATLVKGFFNGLQGGTAGGGGTLVTITNLGGKLRETFQQAWPVIKQTAAQFVQLGRVAAPLLGQAFTVILAVVRQVFTVVGPIVGQIRAMLIGVFRQAAPQIVSSMQSIREIVVGVLTIIQALWKRFGPTILAVAKNAFTTIFKVIAGVLKAVAGVVKLVMALIKGDWKGAWAAIKQITSGLWSAIKALVAGSIRQMQIILSAGWAAIKSLTSRAWAGIKSAVSSAVSGLLAVVRGIPGRIKAALGKLGSLLYSAGRDVINGLLRGISDMAGAVVQKARDIAGSVKDTIADALKIRSPSKVMRELGRFVGQGFARGIDDTSRLVKTAAAAVAAAGRRTFQRGIADEASALNRAIRGRDALTARIVAAKKRLTDALAVRSDFAKTIADNVRSFGSITSIQDTGSAGNIVTQLKERLEKAKAFAADLARLQKLGLNGRTFRELVEAGPEAGAAAAAALAAGGKGAVGQVNVLARQIGQTADALGKSSARRLYQAGVDAARGVVRGLESQRSSLRKTMGRLADDLVRAVRRALKISSPSKVTEQLGQQTGIGFAQGVMKTRGIVAAAMTSATSPVTDRRRLGTTSANAGRSGGIVVEHLEVKSFSDRFSLRQVQDELALQGAA